MVWRVIKEQVLLKKYLNASGRVTALIKISKTTSVDKTEQKLDCELSGTMSKIKHCWVHSNFLPTGKQISCSVTFKRGFFGTAGGKQCPFNNFSRKNKLSR